MWNPPRGSPWEFSISVRLIFYFSSLVFRYENVIWTINWTEAQSLKISFSDANLIIPFSFQKQGRAFHKALNDVVMSIMQKAIGDLLISTNLNVIRGKSVWGKTQPERNWATEPGQAGWLQGASERWNCCLTVPRSCTEKLVKTPPSSEMHQFLKASGFRIHSCFLYCSALLLVLLFF